MGLIAELKRRNVFRVAIAYAVMGWLLAQVADLAFDNFGAPEWVPKSFLFVLILGFPLAIFFAWAFELTPEGLKREKEVDRSRSITHQTGRKLDFMIIGVLVLAVGLLLVDRFRGADDADGVAPVAVIDEADEVTTTEQQRSIAVLPFDNRSNREEDRFFTDGIHDDLLTTIANIGSLRVISRTSVMQYRDTTKRVPDIARELGVGTILEGGVQRAGNQVRINVQLIDAESDEHLWAEIYDRELTAENLFKIQSEVSNAIAEALHATLSPEDRKRVNSIGTTSLEAYEKYMLGRVRWRERTADGINAAVTLFSEAVELDPEYAAAWAGLSDTYRVQPSYMGVDTNEAWDKARQAAERALALDQTLAEAHTSLAGMYAARRQFEDAIVSFERALELNPNYEWAYLWYGGMMEELGYAQRTRELFAKAAELDPLSIVMINNLSTSLQAVGAFDESLARAERAIEIAPDSPMGYRSVALYHFAMNRLDESVRWYRRGLEVLPGDLATETSLCFAYLALGELDGAKTLLSQVQETHPDAFQPRVLKVSLHVAEGEMAEATKVSKEIAADFPGQTPPYADGFLLLVVDDFESGRPDEALARIVAAVPELDAGSTRDMGWNALVVGPTAAYIHAREGRTTEARRIVERVLDLSNEYPVNGYWGYDVARVRAYAALGDVDRAIDEYERYVDAGAGYYYLPPAPELAVLRDEPRFQALVARVQARLAEQRENLRDVDPAFEW